MRLKSEDAALAIPAGQKNAVVAHVTHVQLRNEDAIPAILVQPKTRVIRVVDVIHAAEHHS